MGNLVSGFKRFLANKNTVTALAILAGILVLWFFYNMRVTNAVKPIRVPIAKQEIASTDQITPDMIDFVEVNSDFLVDNDIITNHALVENMYVAAGASVPKGGLFHESQIVEKSELPNSILDDIPDGSGLFNLAVNNNSTYGNSIMPGDHIDLYVKYVDELGIINFGKFIESIPVLAVRDSKQEDVFDDTDIGQSALLLFALPDDLYNLLQGGSFISGFEIIPVPRNKNYTDEAGTTLVKSQAIKTYIEVKTNITTDS